MRRLTFATLLPIIVPLLGCDDGVVRPAPGPGTSWRAVASFTADAQGGGAITLSGSGVSSDTVLLEVSALWTEQPLDLSHPSSLDLLLRVDPAAGAEVVTEAAGSWCGAMPTVTATGTPGEWRIQRQAEAGDCSCIGDGRYYSYFTLVRFNLRVGAGTWRVDVAPASATPACECEEGCFPDAFHGGSIAAS